MVDCEEGIQATFADIEQLAQQCRFHDCEQPDQARGGIRCHVDDVFVIAGFMADTKLDIIHQPFVYLLFR